MPVTINIATTYDDTTQELKSVATILGLVDTLPNEVVTAQHQTTLVLTGVNALAASDCSKIVNSVARTLQAANYQLDGWKAANANQDKASELVGATIDPVGTFDAALETPH